MPEPPVTAAPPHRFDDSFVLRMIRDFFFGLLMIIALELGARYALVLWRYNNQEVARTEAAARNLAEDVRAIMLNRGGPVAARTVYPILKRDHAQFGLEIAITPSPDTVRAVGALVPGTPRGIPPDWPEGVHHEARVDILAEPFCIQCHSASDPGDTLGSVTVRNYRDTHLAVWWQDVWLSGVFGMGNIILDVIVLLILLRLRMEPLLGLRAVVAELAGSGGNLEHRAPVRSDDEFGALAHDLNRFLDRLSLIAGDMGRVLSEMDALSTRMRAACDAVDRQTDALARDVAAISSGPNDADLAALRDAVAALARRVDAEAHIPARSAEAAPGAVDTGAAERAAAQMQALSRSARDLRLLEERMQTLAAEGQRLLARLNDRPAAPA
ncbi:methyl-accepting chemotaxis protein [Maritimibacter sp. 55A14]|uniref:HAMP domain-containing protein n=1 Tax=Maritimibacter sp. 55A14 TaxID=2174844 RepID=UPI001304D3F1|nr:methyl-accepting chemotaxis protein [Maritimibacter sp. 55A14]